MNRLERKIRSTVQHYNEKGIGVIGILLLIL